MYLYMYCTSLVVTCFYSQEVPLIYSTTPEASLVNFDAKDAKPVPVPLFSVAKV